jgi:transcriptional regulator with XRE-family HTH domain
METRLKEARTARGWSQLRLITELERRATALHLNLPSRASLKTQVSRWENGHVSPDDLYASLLAEIYETTPLDLDLGSSAKTPAVQRLPGATPTGPVSGEWLGCMEAVLAEYARTDNEVGPRFLIRGVTQHLTQLEQMALAARGLVREEAFRLCSRFAEFAGWLCQDAGDLLEAERWTDRALDYVEHSGDEHARAYILMRKSTIAAERRECPRAVALAVAAGRAPEGKPSHLQALVFRQLATHTRSHPKHPRASAPRTGPSPRSRMAENP